MTPRPVGLDQVLRQATSHLAPDVDRLVAGAVERGRARRRRHLAGTAVAALATVGIIGAGAVAVPPPGPDAAREVPVTTQGGSTTPSPSHASRPRHTASHLSDPEGPTLAAADIPRRVAELVTGHRVGGPLTVHPYPLVDEDGEKVVHFRVDGMLATIVITAPSASLAYDCTDEATVACRTLSDGTIVQVPGPTVADGVTMRSVLAVGETWMVTVMSYNAVEGKDVAPAQPEPPLTEDELTTLATSGAWFG